jgi:ribosomal protein S18 acetylase RimI-like enzyme
MNIRPVQLADLDIVLGLAHDYQTDHVWQLSNRGATTEIQATLRLARLPRTIDVTFAHDETARRRTLHRADFAWVAEEGPREILGYLAMTLLPWQNTAWVTLLNVRPENRRKGIGSQLLRTAHTQAREEGMHSVSADVPAKNYPATRFYQGRGFRFAGYAENFYSAFDIALIFASRIR